VTGATGVAGDPGATGATGPASPKAITVINPTTSEKIPLFYTSTAITISHVESLVAGTSPSVTFNIRHNADFSTTGTQLISGGVTTTNTTTGTATTTFDNPSVTGGSFVWLTTTATAGTVDQFHVTVLF
jgi:hypothetical protein